MELEGATQVAGPWVDRTVGLDGVRADVAMMRTLDGHGRIELSKFHSPPAVRAEPQQRAVERAGHTLHQVRATSTTSLPGCAGTVAELAGEIAPYEDVSRPCSVRGPEGIIIGLAEQLR